MSSSVFGYNALFTKAASSISPMLILNILNRYDYQTLVAKGAADSESGNGVKGSGMSQLHHAMFTVACCMPVLVGCAQLLVWYPFSIRNSHITVPKHIEN